MKIQIENVYVCGHTSTAEVDVAESPITGSPTWWHEEVFPHTGDGHDPDCDGTYTATVTEATDPVFVGQTCTWG